MGNYIVEYEYKTPFTDEKHNEGAARLDPCLARYGVTWIASYLAVDRLKMVCEFEAESMEHIRDALRSAEVSFAKVWPALKYTRR
jgi:hypothetical protein